MEARVVVGVVCDMVGDSAIGAAVDDEVCAGVGLAAPGAVGAPGEELLFGEGFADAGAWGAVAAWRGGGVALPSQPVASNASEQVARAERRMSKIMLMCTLAKGEWLLVGGRLTEQTSIRVCAGKLWRKKVGRCKCLTVKFL